MRLAAAKPIKDYCLGIFDGPHATPAEATEGPIFLGIKNITADGRLDFSETRHVSESEFPKWTRRVVPTRGDVVFTYEATLHRYALIPAVFRGCLGRRVALVRPDPVQVDSRFLLYYFLSHAWRSVVESNVISGATVDRIPLERFPSFRAALPPLPMQQRIGQTLSAYDDLIDNNTRRIKLLEDSVRLLFDEWFVRRHVPSGTPPADQSESKNSVLGDLCLDVKVPVLPEAVDADTPYIGLEHMPRRSITLSDWGSPSDVSSMKLRFSAGDIVFGKIRPYFHKVGVALTDGVASSDAIIIRAKRREWQALLVALISSDPFVAATSQCMKEGSKMPRADWKQMKAYPLRLSDPQTLARFNELAEPAIAQLKTLALQSRALRTARDLLLPRLMSGEIEV